MANRIPEKLTTFTPLIGLIPQISLTFTSVALFLIILSVSPDKTYTTFPILLILISYWIWKFIDWRKEK